MTKGKKEKRKEGKRDLIPIAIEVVTPRAVPSINNQTPTPSKARPRSPNMTFNMTKVHLTKLTKPLAIVRFYFLFSIKIEYKVFEIQNNLQRS